MNIHSRTSLSLGLKSVVTHWKPHSEFESRRLPLLLSLMEYFTNDLNLLKYIHVTNLRTVSHSCYIKIDIVNRWIL